VPKNFVFENSPYPWPYDNFLTVGDPMDSTRYDFFGIKMGDLNQSVKPNVKELLLRTNPPIFPWMVHQQKYEADEMIEIPLYGNSPEIVQGFQFTITSPDLEFVDITSGAIEITQGDFGLFHDKLTLSWFDLDGISLSGDAPAFTLRARTKTSSNLKASLLINSDITEASLFTPMEEIFIPVLYILDKNDRDVILFSPEPNPWTEQTVIPFYLSEAGDVSFEVFTLHGRSIFTHKSSYLPGYNHIVLHADAISAHGLLVFSLCSGISHVTQKMFRLK
jgi:hypothetical protein